MRRSLFAGLFGLFSSVGLLAQGNLQFNQVLVINAQSGTQTVPAGKVWKVTSQNPSGGIYFTNWSNGSITWSVTNPNPCTGATSGTTSLKYVYKRKCPDSNNKIIINGTKTELGNHGPIWLPAGATLGVSQTPCANTLSPNIPGATPYRVSDLTNPNNQPDYYECDGPINVGFAPNSILVSVIEFNIVP